MDDITMETRLESYLMRPTRAQEVLDYITEHGPCTARQVMIGLKFSDMNAVRPRLTELLKAGQVQTIGKAVDGNTGKNVAVFAEKGWVPLWRTRDTSSSTAR